MLSANFLRSFQRYIQICKFLTLKKNGHVTKCLRRFSGRMVEFKGILTEYVISSFFLLFQMIYYIILYFQFKIDDHVTWWRHNNMTIGIKQNWYKTVFYTCGGDKHVPSIKTKVTLVARLLLIFPCLFIFYGRVHLSCWFT